MTSRERLLSALEHKEPDRVPLDLGGWVSTISKTAYDRLTEHLGMDVKGEVIDWVQQTVIPDEKVLKRLGIDIRYVRPGAPKGWEFKMEEKGDYYFVTDIWGVKRKMPKQGGYYFDIFEHPLKSATVEDLDKYPWPDPEDPGYTEGLEEKARYLHENTNYAVAGDFNWASPIESNWYMRGMEDWLIDMITNQKFIEALLEKLCALHIRWLSKVLDATGKYLDVVLQGDDLTVQNGPLYSPQLYRKFVKPWQKRIFDLIRSKTNAKIFYHTCGSASFYIEDLIEIGVDIINPIQVTARNMNIEELKKKYGDRITFWGAIDTQALLPKGRPEEIEKEVKRTIEILGKDGGYVLGSVHNILADVPPENILAMFDTAGK